MSLSRWKMMAGVLGVSIGGLAAAASQCPKFDTSKGRTPEAPVAKTEPKVPSAGPASPMTPATPPAPSTGPAAPVGLDLPSLPTPPSAGPAVPPSLAPAGTTPPLPAIGPRTSAPAAPPTPPAPAMPMGVLPSLPTDVGPALPAAKPTKPTDAAPPALPLLPGTPAKPEPKPSKPMPPSIGDLVPPSSAVTLPPSVDPIPLNPGPAGSSQEKMLPKPPVVGASGIQQSAPIASPPNVGNAVPPPPSGFQPPQQELPPSKPMVLTQPPAPAAGQTPFRIVLRVGEGEPTFEVKNGDNLVLKVACEKVDIKSPEKGGMSEVIAKGKVRFAGFGAEGSCDELKFFAGTGEVSMSGDVKVQVKDKLGRIESELTTGSMKYKIDASAVGGSLKP